MDFFMKQPKILCKLCISCNSFASQTAVAKFLDKQRVSQKKGNNRMLLEPRCTSSIVSSRHPLGLKNRFNFGYIYPSQRHNLTPILEIMTQISQIFPVISKISKTNPKFSRNFPNPQRGHRMDQRGRRRKFQIFHFFPENFQNSGYTT